MIPEPAFTLEAFQLASEGFKRHQPSIADTKGLAIIRRPKGDLVWSVTYDASSTSQMVPDLNIDPTPLRHYFASATPANCILRDLTTFGFNMSGQLIARWQVRYSVKPLVSTRKVIAPDYKSDESDTETKEEKEQTRTLKGKVSSRVTRVAAQTNSGSRKSYRSEDAVQVLQQLLAILAACFPTTQSRGSDFRKKWNKAFQPNISQRAKNAFYARLRLKYGRGKPRVVPFIKGDTYHPSGLNECPKSSNPTTNDTKACEALTKKPHATIPPPDYDLMEVHYQLRFFNRSSIDDIRALRTLAQLAEGCPINIVAQEKAYTRLMRLGCTIRLPLIPALYTKVLEHFKLKKEAFDPGSNSCQLIFE